MSTMLKRYWKILILDPEPFQALKEADDSLWLALKLSLIVGLLAGLGKLSGLAATVTTPTPAERINDVAVSIEELAIELPRFLTKFLQEAADVTREIAALFAGLEPPLGAPLSRLITGIGDWLSTPFEILAVLWGILFAIWLVAKLMGGRGSLRQHFSLLSLAVAPQVLILVGFVATNVATNLDLASGLIFSPVYTFGLLASVWSVLIVYRALVIAHDLHPIQAFEILVIYFTVFVVLFPLLLLLLGVYVLSLVL